MAQLAETLVQLRKRMGWTQTELAERLEVTVRTEQRYETDGPPEDRLEKLVEIARAAEQGDIADKFVQAIRNGLSKYAEGRQAPEMTEEEAVEVGLLLEILRCDYPDTVAFVKADLRKYTAAIRSSDAMRKRGRPHQQR